MSTKPITIPFSQSGRFKYNEKDLTGEIFNRTLLVLHKTTKRNVSGEVIWKCKCLCGRLCEYTTYQIRSGKCVTCGCRIKAPEGDKDPFNSKTRWRTKERKGRKSYLKQTKKVKDAMLSRYINGEQAKDLCEEFGISIRSFNDFIVDYRHKLNQQYELSFIENMKPFNVSKLRIDKVLERRFTTKALDKVLSKPEAKVLTNEEMLYAILYVRSGSNTVALAESGFKDCLKVKDSARYKLLGMYLQEKPNVARYIMELRENNLKNLSVTKDKVQLDIVEQIDQLKEEVASEGSGPSARTNLLKAIDMLGRSIGAFSEKITVEQVDPSEALDKLIEMSKEQVTSTYTEIDYYDDEDDGEQDD